MNKLVKVVATIGKSWKRPFARACHYRPLWRGKRATFGTLCQKYTTNAVLHASSKPATFAEIFIINFFEHK